MLAVSSIKSLSLGSPRARLSGLPILFMLFLYMHGTAKYSVLKYTTSLTLLCIFIYFLLWHVNAFALYFNGMHILSSLIKVIHIHYEFGKQIDRCL